VSEIQVNVPRFLEWDREAAWKLCESFTEETVLNFGGTETEALSLKYYVAP